MRHILSALNLPGAISELTAVFLTTVVAFYSLLCLKRWEGRALLCAPTSDGLPLHSRICPLLT